MKLKIKVTKSILWESRYCGFDVSNCAVSRAVKDIFPQAITVHTMIIPFPVKTSGQLDEIVKASGGEKFTITLPREIGAYISEFDKCEPADRVLMDKIEFEVDISDAIIEKINIDEIRPLLKNHPSLQLV